VLDLPSIPVWLVALFLAAAAPGCVRLLQARFERRLRRRTLDTIAPALSFSDSDTLGAGVQADERERRPPGGDARA
jgi:hypothetical protein